MPAKKTILFVDDEPNVLSSLRRSLRREGWELLFAQNGNEGLEHLANHSIDLVISDVCMPNMDGVEFLKRAQSAYPHITRLVLTGHADREVVRTVFTEIEIHDMIPKPWEEDQLRKIIRGALAQAETHELSSPGLHELINQLPLPTPPKAYATILRALDRQDELDAEQIANILLQSPFISARIMQTANSSFFGQRREIETPAAAIVVLGIDIIKSIVMLTSILQDMPCDRCSGLSTDKEWKHSITSSAIAYQLAQLYPISPSLCGAAITACVLHDIGKSLWGHHRPLEYADIITLAQKKAIPLHEAEYQAMSTDHAELGGYVLRWWNMPYRIVEAVTLHHTPECATLAPELAHLVHLADIIANLTAEDSDNTVRISEDMLHYFDLNTPGQMDELVAKLNL